MQETELKLHTPDHAPLRAALQARGAQCLQPRVFERNLRFDCADAPLRARGIVLRLRQDNAARLTYKSDAREDKGIISRYEAEVEVSDLATTQAILQRLGYHVALVYEKYRTTYAYGGTHIMLDELPYGKFTEIEGDAAAIERVLCALSMQRARRIRASYVDLFLSLKARLHMDTRDCSFEAFTGIHVDIAAGWSARPPAP